MKALTIWQPWATLIVNGLKPFEFRRWAAPKVFVGRPLMIHAAARAVDRQDVHGLLLSLQQGKPTSVEGASERQKAETVAFLERLLDDPSLAPRSVCLGHVLLGGPRRAIDLFGTSHDPDEIDPDMWAWPMLGPQPLPEPIPAVGKQGLWEWRA